MESRPKISASTIAPAAVTNHPNKDIGPKAAKDDGNRKMPEPTMLPTTNAVQVQNPSDIFFGAAIAPVSVTRQTNVAMLRDAMITIVRIISSGNMNFSLRS